MGTRILVWLRRASVIYTCHLTGHLINTINENQGVDWSVPFWLFFLLLTNRKLSEFYLTN